MQLHQIIPFPSVMSSTETLSLCLPITQKIWMNFHTKFWVRKQTRRDMCTHTSTHMCTQTNTHAHNHTDKYVYNVAVFKHYLPSTWIIITSPVCSSLQIIFTQKTNSMQAVN